MILLTISPREIIKLKPEKMENENTYKLNLSGINPLNRKMYVYVEGQYQGFEPLERVELYSLRGNIEHSNLFNVSIDLEDVSDRAVKIEDEEI